MKAAMTPFNYPPIAAAALLLLSCAHAQAPASAVATTAEAGRLEVFRTGSRPSTTGASANFTGHVVVTPLFSATPQTRATGGSVTFEPGARSAWHTHPAGQTLIITAGTGWVQEWDGEKVEVHAGDVVWTPPGVKHWHGATATESMTHIAIQEGIDGSVVDWLEHVSAEQYER